MLNKSYPQDKTQSSRSHSSQICLVVPRWTKEHLPDSGPRRHHSADGVPKPLMAPTLFL